MALLLILPILVSGYLLCLKHPALFIKLHKFDGQLLYLHVARLGLACVFYAFLIVSAVSSVFSHSFQERTFFEGTRAEFGLSAHNMDFIEALGVLLIKWDFVKNQGAADLMAFVLLVSAVAVALPWPWAKLGIWWLEYRKGIKTPKAAVVYLARQASESSPLGLALIDAFTGQTKIMLSMDDRKVYVCFVTDISPPNEVLGPNEEIKVIPLISGYRDKDTLKVIYTTDYAEAAGDVSPLILRQSNIVSITTFSEEIRQAFDKQDTKSKEDEATTVEVPKTALVVGGLAALLLLLR